MLKLLYLAELVDIIIKYIASNTSLMMSPERLATQRREKKMLLREEGLGTEK